VGTSAAIRAPAASHADRESKLLARQQSIDRSQAGVKWLGPIPAEGRSTDVTFAGDLRRTSIVRASAATAMTGFRRPRSGLECC